MVFPPVMVDAGEELIEDFRGSKNEDGDWKRWVVAVSAGGLAAGATYSAVTGAVLASTATYGTAGVATEAGTAYAAVGSVGTLASASAGVVASAVGTGGIALGVMGIALGPGIPQCWKFGGHTGGNQCEPNVDTKAVIIYSNLGHCYFYFFDNLHEAKAVNNSWGAIHSRVVYHLIRGRKTYSIWDFLDFLSHCCGVDEQKGMVEIDRRGPKICHNACRHAAQYWLYESLKQKFSNDNAADFFTDDEFWKCAGRMMRGQQWA